MVLGEWVPDVLKILRNAGITHPTKRRVFYTMAQKYTEFPKQKEYYKSLIRHLSNASLRWRDYKDWDGYNYRLDTFSDDSRSDVIVPRYRKPKQFVQEYVFGIKHVFDNYDIPYWEEQGCVVEIMTEKQSMESSFDQVAKPKHVAVIVNKGDTGTTYLYDQYLRWKKYQQEDNKSVHVLFFSDLDYDGEYMHKNMIDKILRMIEIDVKNGKEPLNWDWDEKNDWNNVKELYADIGYERRKNWNRKIVGDDYDNKEKQLRFASKLLELSKASWHDKHYDPNKPNFTFERIGLTEEQAEKLELTKLDVTPISQISPGTEKYDFAKRHNGYSYAVELDAFLIEQQDAFEELVNEAIDKWHNEEIWERVQDKYGEKVKDREIEKRIKFTGLAEREYEQWKNDELPLDDDKDEGPAPDAKVMKTNPEGTSKGERVSFSWLSSGTAKRNDNSGSEE